MKKYIKVSISNYSGQKKYRWAFRMLFIAISMSLFFGYISQTLLSKMGIIVATLGIIAFIFFSVLFDMIGIAAASADIDIIEIWKNENIKGANMAFILCQNSEKLCCFCADVVGDICSTLCGAGGACIVVAITQNVFNENIILFASIFVSALIAGITVFFKALMKEKALKNSNKVLLTLGKICEIFIKQKK